jgi:hypothetical protein
MKNITVLSKDIIVSTMLSVKYLSYKKKIMELSCVL